MVHNPQSNKLRTNCEELAVLTNRDASLVHTKHSKVPSGEWPAV